MNIYLVVDGIQLADDSRKGLNQKITPISSGSAPRLANGSAIYRGVWKGKYATQISGGGWAPSGFHGIDFTQPVLIKSIESISVTSLTSVVTLPGTFRTDAPLLAYAMVNGDLVETEITGQAGNAMTLATVDGAVNYRVEFWPEFYVLDAKFDEEMDAASKTWNWSITAEEQ